MSRAQAPTAARYSPYDFRRVRRDEAASVCRSTKPSAAISSRSMKRLLWAALLVSGCVKSDSQDILTHGIYADIGAQANGTGTTTVHATLYFGNPVNLNFVELTGTDALIASSGGQDKVMTETSILNIVSHTATFSTDADGAQFVVDFQRTV